MFSFVNIGGIHSPEKLLNELFCPKTCSSNPWIFLKENRRINLLGLTGKINDTFIVAIIP